MTHAPNPVAYLRDFPRLPGETDDEPRYRRAIESLGGFGCVVLGPMERLMLPLSRPDGTGAPRPPARSTAVEERNRETGTIR